MLKKQQRTEAARVYAGVQGRGGAPLPVVAQFDRRGCPRSNGAVVRQNEQLDRALVTRKKIET